MGILFATASLSMVRGNRWTDEIQLVDSVTGVPVNLTGIAALMMRIRKGINTPILLELSLNSVGSAGRLVINDAVLGKVGIVVNAATSRTLPEASNRRAKYIYDCVIDRGAGEFEAAYKGKLTVNPQITRPWGAT